MAFDLIFHPVLLGFGPNVYQGQVHLLCHQCTKSDGSRGHCRNGIGAGISFLHRSSDTLSEKSSDDGVG